MLRYKERVLTLQKGVFVRVVGYPQLKHEGANNEGPGGRRLLSNQNSWLLVTVSEGGHRSNLLSHFSLKSSQVRLITVRT